MSTGGSKQKNAKRNLTPEEEAKLIDFFEQEFHDHPIDRRKFFRRQDERRTAGRGGSDRRAENRRQNTTDVRILYYRQKFLDLISAIRSSGLDLESSL